MKNFSAHILFLLSLAFCIDALAIDNPGICGRELRKDRFTLIQEGVPVCAIAVETDEAAVKIAAKNLADDFERVTGSRPPVKSGRRIVVRIDPALAGKRELYKITFDKSDLVISGSDRRGAVYGIYELSEQIGVSPWYDWADAPLPKHRSLGIDIGEYTNGEPAVRYRGIFLNDEAPCLTSWVKNTYGTDFGDHRFYARVGELILRLRGNFLWPAMWCWAFYADDPENSKTFSDMGVIVGTSHHEPMARNHQEWARRRKEYGAWNYGVNKDVIDGFFAEGVRRAKDTEDLITIGMRGDGDEEIEGDSSVAFMENIIANQRAIIERETGRKACEVPQVWALYKEVLDYYDKGLRVPDDVTLLLCDDNWGNVRRLPNAEERSRPGGWGMYYHVDYVGAPRNSKFLNVTSAMGMWEQLSLAYEYGVDRLWILNVGDLKPMEYPISLFMDMAWKPGRYTPKTLHAFTVGFCERIVGRKEAKEAARILDTTSRWAARVTPEMLDANTYDLGSGEWKKVRDDYQKLLADAEAQYARISENCKAAYFEIILFHVRVMANLYDMYYSQSNNLALAGADDAKSRKELDYWADRVEDCFRRHAAICGDYNFAVAGGKWCGMMTQKVIGYTSWNDGFPADKCPKVKRSRERQANSLAWLDESEPRIYSIQRSKSFDRNMGENWWMRRHEATLEKIRAEKEFDLVLIGDSITHRWERHGKEAYVDVTNSLRVLNLGYGADNVKNCLWRLRDGELDGYRAKVVQLMIGTNNGVNESAEETAGQIRACIREIHARQPQAKILLSAILPRGNPDSVERGKNDAVNELLKPLCDGEKIIWHDWSGFFTLPDGRLKPDLQDDSLHPNAKGYAAWRDAALPLWKELVEGRTPEKAKRIAPRLRETSVAKANSKHISIEAEHYVKALAPDGARWEVLHGLGRTLSGVEVFPRTLDPKGAKLVYDVKIPSGVDEVDVTVVTRSTLAFARKEGHRYTVGFAGGDAKEINFNERLNEDKENIYSVFYPTVARRVVAKTATLKTPPAGAALELAPLDPGVAFEKIVVSWGDKVRTYLFD